MLIPRTISLLNQRAATICLTQSPQRMTTRFLTLTYKTSNWMYKQNNIHNYYRECIHKQYHHPTSCLFENFSGFRQLSQTTESLNYEVQNQRGFIRIHGKDSLSFLQGLITNDMSCLDRDCKALYAMVLNVQGRVMYDIILYNISTDINDPTYLLECDKEIVSDLHKELKKYKIRKKVKLEPSSDEYKLWTIFPNDLHAVLDNNITSSDSIQHKEGLLIAVQDPRLKDFCARLILDSTMKGSDFICGATEPSIEQAYNTRRYIHGVSEGIKDLPVGKCTPLESNAVFLNGVSFTKGCYIGQELTARTHHTGVIRKRLMPMIIQKEDVIIPPDSKIQNASNKNVGRFRHNIGKYGLGLLRVADIKEGSLSIYLDEDGKESVAAEANVPYWWPQLDNLDK